MVDLIALVEARALEKLGGVVPPDPPPLPPRPQVPRVFSFGRGDPRCVWIFGRQVSASADGLSGDASFEDFLVHGFPPDIAAKLGAECVARVTAAVSSLAPLPCMCETGAETVEQHGTIEHLASADNPESYVDDRASCGRCRVCGRIWTFEVSGDPYYEMHYRATLSTFRSS
jgi:hypothetical protein